MFSCVQDKSSTTTQSQVTSEQVVHSDKLEEADEVKFSIEKASAVDSEPLVNEQSHEMLADSSSSSKDPMIVKEVKVVASRKTTGDEAEKDEIVTRQVKKTGVKPQKDSKVGVMRFSNEVFDFGYIEMGKQIDHTFEFVNVGNQAINISDATATCGCTTPSYTFIPIEPGEKGQVGVHFNSTGRLGGQSAIITVVSDSKEKIKKLEIKGIVTAEMAAQPKDSLSLPDSL